VLIGIHTPETDGEKHLPTVKKKIKEAGLKHPIAVDNKSTMWQRYHNAYWPSIYLFDKKGIARWGWAGELTWRGARGDIHMRRKIDELLRE
jgi:hypothetical protein